MFPSVFPSLFNCLYLIPLISHLSLGLERGFPKKRLIFKVSLTLSTNSQNISQKLRLPQHLVVFRVSVFIPILFSICPIIKSKDFFPRFLISPIIQVSPDLNLFESSPQINWPYIIKLLSFKKKHTIFLLQPMQGLGELLTVCDLCSFCF